MSEKALPTHFRGSQQKCVNLRVMFSIESGVFVDVLTLEDRGLALTMTSLRVGYAAGGDGELSLRSDIRNLAGFVRDPSAAVSAVLLPLSCTVKYDGKVGTVISS